MHRHVVLPHAVGLQLRRREALQAAGRLPEDPVQRSEPPSYEEVARESRGRRLNEDPASGGPTPTSTPNLDLAAARGNTSLDGHSHQHNLLHCAERYVGGDGNSDGEVPETVVLNPPPVPVINLTGDPEIIDLTGDSSSDDEGLPELIDEVNMSDDLSEADADPELGWNLVSRKRANRDAQSRGGR